MFKLFYPNEDGSKSLQCEQQSEQECKNWAAQDAKDSFSIEFQDDICTTIVWEQ